MAVVSLVWVYPFLWVIFTAFKERREAFTAGASLIPTTWIFDNFPRAWVEAGVSRFFVNTVIYAGSSTVIELLKAALCGYILARYQFPGRTLLYRLIVATLFVPVASIIIPQFELVGSLGLLNTRAGVILALSGAAGALYVLLFVGFFEAMPRELFDAAKVDGAGFVRTFRLVLPLAKPIIAVVVIFNFIAGWNEFNIPFVFTLSQPELQNLAVGMKAFQGDNALDWTGLSAGMVFALVPMLVIFLAFQNYFIRGLAGAVKE
jgi:ABC-type glycerol-3-phosphate transport system permease component